MEISMKNMNNIQNHPAFQQMEEKKQKMITTLAEW